MDRLDIGFLKKRIKELSADVNLLREKLAQQQLFYRIALVLSLPLGLLLGQVIR